MAGPLINNDGIDWEEKNWELEVDDNEDEVRITHKPTGDAITIPQVDLDISSHGGRHEQGGADEMSVGGLAGVLADPQTPGDPRTYPTAEDIPEGETGLFRLTEESNRVIIRTED